MSGCGDCRGGDPARATPTERRTRFIVLLLNTAMFLAEFSAGLLVGSTVLRADSLDMLAAATVYALGLVALGRAPHWRARAAFASGLFRLTRGWVWASRPVAPARGARHGRRPRPFLKRIYGELESHT
jgi:hypothetical protein